MLDGKVISACVASRAAYERVRNHVTTEDLSPQGVAWWKLIENWYATDTLASAVDSALLRARGQRDLPQKHQETLLGWFDALPAAVSPENAVLSLLEVKRFVAEQKLLGALAQLADSNEKMAALDAYRDLLKATSLGAGKLERVTAADWLAGSTRERLVRIAPTALNDATGGMGAGDVGYIFGRPEMGKTLLCVSIVRRLAMDGRKVIYLTNEEAVRKTIGRVIGSLLGWTPAQVEQDRTRAHTLAMERGLGNVVFVHMEPGNMNQVEDEAGMHDPHVVFLDQIRNMAGKADSMTKRLEDNAILFRNLAARYKFAGLGVTQAGDSGDGKIFLDMGDVDNSNTGLPGACDLMVGIGADKSLHDTNRRGISLPKNKLGHSKEGFIVTIDPLRNKVTS